MVKVTPTVKGLVVRRTTKAMATATTTISEGIDYVRIRSVLFCVAPESNVVVAATVAARTMVAIVARKHLGSLSARNTGSLSFVDVEKIG